MIWAKFRLLKVINWAKFVFFNTVCPKQLYKKRGFSWFVWEVRAQFLIVTDWVKLAFWDTNLAQLVTINLAQLVTLEMFF